MARSLSLGTAGLSLAVAAVGAGAVVGGTGTVLSVALFAGALGLAVAVAVLLAVTAWRDVAAERRIERVASRMLHRLEAVPGPSHLWGSDSDVVELVGRSARAAATASLLGRPAARPRPVLDRLNRSVALGAVRA